MQFLATLKKIVAIVPCDIPDTTRPLAPIDDDAKAMSQHLIDFFQEEIKGGRLPEKLTSIAIWCRFRSKRCNQWSC